MVFPITMDQASRAMTAAVFVLVAIAMAPTWFFFFAFARWDALRLAALISTSLVVVVLGVAWAASPVAVALTPDALAVHRRWLAPKRFARQSFAGVDAALPRLGLRVAGVGGFFGSFGLFWVGGLGFYWLYSARLKASAGALLRRHTGKPVVVMPDDGAAFLDAVRAWL